jgi:hypothetical protein
MWEESDDPDGWFGWDRNRNEFQNQMHCYQVMVRHEGCDDFRHIAKNESSRPCEARAEGSIPSNQSNRILISSEQSVSFLVAGQKLASSYRSVRNTGRNKKTSQLPFRPNVGCFVCLLLRVTKDYLLKSSLKK